MSDLEVILGTYTDTTQTLRIASTDSVNTITVTASGGTPPTVSLSQRKASPFLGIDTVQITGLTADTFYTYTVSKSGSTDIKGSFTTKATVKKDVSFIVSTCEKTQIRHPSGAYKVMRNVIESSRVDFPVVARFHIDDWGYVDEFELTAGNEPTYVSTGKPQDTADPEDYAIAWGYQYGLMVSSGKWLNPDKLWVHRNIPNMMSSGDHGVAVNYCRGPDAGGGVGFCYRDPLDVTRYGTGTADPRSGNYQPTDNPEFFAMQELRAWVNDGNPQTNPGELYWGFTLPGINFFCMESLETSEPFNGSDPDASDSKPFYGDSTNPGINGAEQVDDCFTFFGAVAADYNIMAMPTGFSRAGQPWFEKWNDEAERFKVTLDADDNTNGTDAQFLGIIGDNHNMHTDQYDTFFSFGAGMIDGSSVKEDTAPKGWDGKRLFSWGNEQGDTPNGVRLRGGFLHVIYYGSETPARIEVHFYEGGQTNVNPI